MRTRLGAILVGAGLLGGCGYYPVPPEPIRLVDSPSDVMSCRSLGRVGPPLRTEGTDPFVFGSLTRPVPAGTVPVPYGGYGTLPTSDNLAVSLQPARDEALGLGATDLLLTRVKLRDWSYVQPVAYRCGRPAMERPVLRTRY